VYAFPKLHTALDRTVISDDHVVFDEHTITDIAVISDDRAG
jgi:hypothetical protein